MYVANGALRAASEHGNYGASTAFYDDSLAFHAALTDAGLYISNANPRWFGFTVQSCASSFIAKVQMTSNASQLTKDHIHYACA